LAAGWEDSLLGGGGDRRTELERVLLLWGAIIITIMTGMMEGGVVVEDGIIIMGIGMDGRREKLTVDN